MNAEKLLRKLRQHPSLWGENGVAKERQVERLIQKTKRKLPNRKPRVGRYSGLTRRELAMSGTCETDWF